MIDSDLLFNLTYCLCVFYIILNTLGLGLIKKDTICDDKDYYGKLSKNDCGTFCAKKGYHLFNSEKTRSCMMKNDCKCFCSLAGCITKTRTKTNSHYDLFEIKNGMYFSSCYHHIRHAVRFIFWTWGIPDWVHSNHHLSVISDKKFWIREIDYLNLGLVTLF